MGELILQLRTIGGGGGAPGEARNGGATPAADAADAATTVAISALRAFVALTTRQQGCTTPEQLHVARRQLAEGIAAAKAEEDAKAEDMLRSLRRRYDAACAQRRGRGIVGI
eukprot:COSAG01_NODE_226_length_21147_cov_59.226435_18_plen_112_part_00